MIVEFPVYMAVDYEGRPGINTRPLSEVNFRVRFDTEDDSKPIEYAKVYGNKVGKFWSDTGDVFATMFDSDSYRKLVERAKASPEDYAPTP
jgi:hypothetical protein